MNTKIITVRTSSLPELRKAYGRVIRAAKKLGFEMSDAGLQIDWATKRERPLRVETTVRNEDGAFPQATQRYMIETVDVSISVPAIGAASGKWKTVAIINRVAHDSGSSASGENEVFSEDRAIVDAYRRVTLSCVHCSSNRYRVKTVVCRSVESGRLIQLGMECAKHYVGDAERELAELEFQSLICETIFAYEDSRLADDEGSRGSSGVLKAYEAEEVIAHTVAVIRTYGSFVPSREKSAYDDEPGTVNEHATWRMVQKRLDAPITDFEGNVTSHPTDDDKSKARAVAAWLSALEPKPDDNFLVELKAVFSPGWISSKKLALACSVTRAYDRAAEMAADAANPPTAAAPDGRVEVEGTVQSLKEYDGDFGRVVKMLVKLTTGAKVFCSVPSGAHPVIGQSLRFVATFTRSEKDQFFAVGKIPKLPKAKVGKAKKLTEQPLLLAV